MRLIDYAKKNVCLSLSFCLTVSLCLSVVPSEVVLNLQRPSPPLTKLFSTYSTLEIVYVRKKEGKTDLSPTFNPSYLDEWYGGEVNIPDTHQKLQFCRTTYSAAAWHFLHHHSRQIGEKGENGYGNTTAVVVTTY